VKQLLADGEIDMGHARTILGLSKAPDMVALANAVVDEKLTVRQTEARVKGQRPAGSGSAPKKANGVSPDAKKLIEDLQRRLGTKVRLVERGSGKGTLEIEFYSYEDLDRIIHLVKR